MSRPAPTPPRATLQHRAHLRWLRSTEEANPSPRQMPTHSLTRASHRPTPGGDTHDLSPPRPLQRNPNRHRETARARAATNLPRPTATAEPRGRPEFTYPRPTLSTRSVHDRPTAQHSAVRRPPAAHQEVQTKRQLIVPRPHPPAPRLSADKLSASPRDVRDHTVHLVPQAPEPECRLRRRTLRPPSGLNPTTPRDPDACSRLINAGE